MNNIFKDFKLLSILNKNFKLAVKSQNNFLTCPKIQNTSCKNCITYCQKLHHGSATYITKQNPSRSFTLNFDDVKVLDEGAFVQVMKLNNGRWWLVDICSDDKDPYRFGFNGQMKVNEMSGVGNYLDFKFRGYDSRTARFNSVDPLFGDYPWNSTYAFAENRVIDGIDLEGKEYSSSVTTQYFQSKGTKFTLLNTKSVSMPLPFRWSKEAVINGKLYYANSSITTMGRDNSPTRGSGDFTGVTSLNENNIAKLMAYGMNVIANDYNSNIDKAFKAESGTNAALDYKYKAYELLNIPKDNLLEINDVLYNANEAGNYLWGMLHEYAGEASDFKGGWFNPALAADYKTIVSQGRMDEGHEQRAIKVGQKQGDKYSDDKEFNKTVKENLGNNAKNKFTGDTK